MADRPSAATDQDWVGEPVTDMDSKKTMLRAERGDTLFVEGVGEVTVARRTSTYFGPSLVLHDEDKGQNWKLTSPGPNAQLQLWEPVRAEGGGRKGWRKNSEVTAEIAGTKAYNICACGEPIKNAEHQRLAFFGIGEHE